MPALGKITHSTILRRANGADELLIDFKDWDFSWQDTYTYKEEVIVQPDDLLEFACNWDNSAKNQQIINGVQQTSRYVEWGDGSGDEMCLMMLYVTKAPTPTAVDEYNPTLHIEQPFYGQVFKPGQIIPISLVVNNFTLEEPASVGHHEHEEEHLTSDSNHSSVNAGHYHIYLDNEEDSAAHITYWEDEYFYQLPADIAEGEHTLRVNLRAGDHHALGIEDRITFQVSAAESSSNVKPLIDVAEWAMQTAEEDSLASHRPAEVICPDNSWYDEDGALEVETGFCNYFSVSQPAKQAIKRWQEIHLVLWHAQLRFEEPADAHVAISIDGTIFWEENIEIPSGAEIFDTTFRSPIDVPVGAKVEFHLHNHGFNTWSLLSLDLID